MSVGVGGDAVPGKSLIGVIAPDARGESIIPESIDTEELSVRVEWAEVPRTTSVRDVCAPLVLAPPVPPRPKKSSSRMIVSVAGAFCESNVPSRCMMSIVPPRRSKISVLAVCSDDADRPCTVSRYSVDLRVGVPECPRLPAWDDRRYCIASGGTSEGGRE